MQLPVSDGVFAFSAMVLGLVLGSFYTSCVYRFVAGISMLKPRRSFCPACGTTLSWHENIPLLSYIVQGGRCRHCAVRINLRYPLIELISCLWAVALALRFGPGWPWLCYMVFGGIFIVASFIDLEICILPDALTLPGAGLAVVCAATVLDVGVVQSLLGAGVGAGVFWLLQVLYRRLRGLEGIGTGDIKLMLLVGALLGPASLPLVVVLAGVSGLLAGVVYMLKPTGQGLKTRVPFGPFLSLGAMLYILYGKAVVGWYLGLLA